MPAVNDLKKMFQEALHYLGGRAAVMLLGFVSFPLFTRIFSVADYGTINLIVTTIMVLTAVSKFGLQNAVQRFYPEYAKSEAPFALRGYYSTLFLGTAVIGILITVLYVATSVGLLAGRLGPGAKWTLAVASVLIVIRALRAMQVNLLQIERKTALLNISEIINKAGTIGMIVLLVFAWRRGIISFFLGLAIFEAVVVAGLVPTLWKRRLLSLAAFDSSFFRVAMAFSFPLMIAELAWFVLDAGDRFLIQHFLGAEPLGYYAAAYNIAYYVQDLVMLPLNLALFPVCLKIWSTQGEAETKNFLSQSLDYFMLLAIWVLCVFTVTSHDLIVLLASNKFEAAHRLLPWLVGGLVLCALQIFFKPGLLIHKKVFSVARVTVIAGVANVALNVVILPRMGIMGAAVATLLSYALWIFLMAWESLSVLPFKLHLGAWLRYGCAGVLGIWLASRLPVQSLLLSVVTRGLLVTVCYLAGALAVDSRLRTAVMGLKSQNSETQRNPARVVSQEESPEMVNK